VGNTPSVATFLPCDSHLSWHSNFSVDEHIWTGIAPF
jgi:hypothetical protein